MKQLYCLKYNNFVYYKSLQIILFQYVIRNSPSHINRHLTRNLVTIILDSLLMITAELFLFQRNCSAPYPYTKDVLSPVFQAEKIIKNADSFQRDGNYVPWGDFSFSAREREIHVDRWEIVSRNYRLCRHQLCGLVKRRHRKVQLRVSRKSPRNW